VTEELIEKWHAGLWLDLNETENEQIGAAENRKIKESTDFSVKFGFRKFHQKFQKVKTTKELKDRRVERRDFQIRIKFKGHYPLLAFIEENGIGLAGLDQFNYEIGLGCGVFPAVKKNTSREVKSGKLLEFLETLEKGNQGVAVAHKKIILVKMLNDLGPFGAGVQVAHDFDKIVDVPADILLLALGFLGNAGPQFGFHGLESEVGGSGFFVVNVGRGIIHHKQSFEDFVFLHFGEIREHLAQGLD